jgi:hypothetical protein
VKLKTVGLGFVLLVFAGCATVHRDDPIDIYQKTQSYRKYSFGDVWTAALRSADEIGFIVRKATKRVGLIHAEAKKSPDPRYVPSRMNVIIKDRSGRIEVNFHIEFPGQRNNTGKRRTLTNRFFKALRKNLR